MRCCKSFSRRYATREISCTSPNRFMPVKLRAFLDFMLPRLRARLAEVQKGVASRAKTILQVSVFDHGSNASAKVAAPAKDGGHLNQQIT